MLTLFQNQTVTVYVPIGESLSVNAPGASALVSCPADMTKSALVSDASATFGPYQATTRFDIVAVSGAVAWGVDDSQSTPDPGAFSTLSATGLATLRDTLVLPKASGKGIKVDTNAPTFGWRDITGDIAVKGSGVNDPAWSVFRGAISAYEFSASVEKECWIVWHVPHDYVPGSALHFHAHFGNAAAVPNTGNVVWGFDYAMARGYDQEAFPAPTTLLVTKACHATRYMHQIAESVAVTIPNVEVDALILCRVYRKAADAADTCTDAVHLFTTDLHYQSSNMATKQRNGPNFYA